MATFRLPRIPDIEELAVLLDVDGTILDLAPTPQQVVVPAALRETLARLSEATGGALAFVSGRSLRDLDRLFAPLRLPAVAGHGAEFRLAPGTERSNNVAAELNPALRRKCAALAKIGPGITVEDKGYAVALHYRLALEKKALVREAVAEICAGQPTLEVLPGKYVFEIKNSEFNKATGVRELMLHPPFAGRRPIFIGDDTTDEHVFAIMPEFNGFAFSVGDAVGGANGHFDRPGEVRDWLAAVATEKDGAAR